ncbi:MAG: TonB family protein [Myxococcales bacterium]
MRLRSDGSRTAALAAAACCALLLVPVLVPAEASAYEGVVQGSVKTEEPAPPKAPTLTKAPELVQFVEAEFPPEAAAQQLTGEVGLLVDIGADGKVLAAEVASPAGHGFDEAARAAVLQFVFTPAELDGQPAPVRIQYTYKFVMKEAPPPAAEPGAEVKPAQAPESLKGRIVQRASRKPLVGANVHVDETGEDTMTDSDGAFALHLFPGKYTVRVAAVGHHPFKREEVIDEGKLLEVTYYLMPVSFGLFETVVRGERDKREATQRTLQREELQRSPGRWATRSASCRTCPASRAPRTCRATSSCAAPRPRRPAPTWTASRFRCSTTSSAAPRWSTPSSSTSSTSCPAASARATAAPPAASSTPSPAAAPPTRRTAT